MHYVTIFVVRKYSLEGSVPFSEKKIASIIFVYIIIDDEDFETSSQLEHQWGRGGYFGIATSFSSLQYELNGIPIIDVITTGKQSSVIVLLFILHCSALYDDSVLSLPG